MDKFKSILFFLFIVISFDPDMVCAEAIGKIGVGGGIPYGGAGASVEFMVKDKYAFSAGLGSFDTKLGWNIGCKYYISDIEKNFRLRVSFFYGIVEVVHPGLIPGQMFNIDFDEREAITGTFTAVGFEWKFSQDFSFDLDAGYKHPSKDEVIITETANNVTLTSREDVDPGPALSAGIVYHF